MTPKAFATIKAEFAADVARISADMRATKDKWHGRKIDLAAMTTRQREELYALSRDLEKVWDEIR